jgi:hypothetical protein
MEQSNPIDQLKVEFLTIAKEVNEKDKLVAALEFSCSYQTVSRYLRGEVSKERFAKRLLSFLQNRVNQAA